MNHRVLMSSKNHKWGSPEKVLVPTRKYFGGEIDLDPCGAEGSLVRARSEYLIERGEDGLVLPWRGRVYCNPPYGDALPLWLAKAEREHRVEGAEILLLCPARTDTTWFQLAWAASAIAFLRGRLKFEGAPSSAPFPSAVVAWSTDQFVGPRLKWAFGDLAHVVG